MAQKFAVQSALAEWGSECSCGRSRGGWSRGNRLRVIIGGADGARGFLLLSSSICRVRLRVKAMRGGFVEELPRDVWPELLELRAERALEGDGQAGFDCLDAVALGVGIVEVGDFAGDHVAQHVGIVGLPFAGVVVLADKGRGSRVKKAVASGAVPETEITRVLVEYGRQNRVANQV